MRVENMHFMVVTLINTAHLLVRNNVGVHDNENAKAAKNKVELFGSKI